MRSTLLITALFISSFAFSQVKYPFPVKTHSVYPEGKAVAMAYMDISPAKPSDKNILLLHGKNFNGYYWKDVIPFLTDMGYRVIVPDQIGWGMSERAEVHYSFHMLAHNTKSLLDSLGIKKVVVLGHSMGGMLATRFALMYPEVTSRLILENPIGLEDYKTFVPYQPFQKIYDKEKKATYEWIKKYQQTYYPVWKPEYDQYVQAQADDLKSQNFDRIAKVNTATFQMIYEQPVLYEFHRIAVPTLLIIGQLDKTVVGKDQLPEAFSSFYGNYPTLGKRASNLIKGSKLVEMEGVGHVPHIQEIGRFQEAVIKFLIKD